MPPSNRDSIRLAITAFSPLKMAGGLFYQWHLRSVSLRAIRQLLAMDDHLLCDIGVTRHDLHRRHDQILAGTIKATIAMPGLPG